MTKKEILENHRGYGEIGYVLKAMDEYTKQEAIGFVHWITSEQEWVRDESGNWIERMKHNPKVITTEELYTLYLNQP